MTCDVLAIGAHPDDIELGIGGTVALLIEQGYRVALLDLTRALLSTRGDPVTRLREAEVAMKILRASKRLNLEASEGLLTTDPNNLYRLVWIIRRLQPKLVLAQYWEDRHPDHADASRLVQSAVFWSGVAKFGDDQPPVRPHRVAYYFAHWEGPVSFVVDVSSTFEKKLAAGKAYASQFDLKPGEEPNTYISRPDFIERVIARARYYGSRIGAEYGEPFHVREMNRVSDLIAWTGEQGVVG